MPVLSPVDFLLSELARALGDVEKSYEERVAVYFVSGLFRTCDVKQTFGGYVAHGARPLRLVAARADRMERWSTTCSLPAYFSVCERLDNLGTEISC